MFFSCDSCIEVATAMTQARAGRPIFSPACTIARAFLSCSALGVKLSCEPETPTGCRSLPDGDHALAAAAGAAGVSFLTAVSVAWAGDVAALAGDFAGA